MAKAKQYIGESYTDSLGQQWRWDAGKKTYVRNYGASPMASIKRSWDQKIVPAVEQYAERQTRLNQEAFGKYSLDNIRQSVSGMIEENRSLNDQQRGLGVQLLNWVENLGFFIGLHIKTLSAKSIKKLINTLFKIDKIK